jgi:hypothetical protein
VRPSFVYFTPDAAPLMADGERMGPRTRRPGEQNNFAGSARRLAMNVD